MTFNNFVHDKMVCDSGNDNKAVLELRCLARVAAPQLGLSRVRLTVTEPRWCLPCLGKRREIASFTFSEEDWVEGLDGQYVAYAARSLGDLGRFQHLQDDLPVKVKWKAGRRAAKARLDDTLGDVLQLLSSRSRLTLQVVACSDKVSVSWAELGDEVFHETVETSATHSSVTFINKSSGRIITLPAHEDVKAADWIFPGAWTSQDDDLDEEDLKLLNTLNGASSSVTEKPNDAATDDIHDAALPQNEADNVDLPMTTFINTSSGRIITLPAHEEVASSPDWIFPGAWTSQDDRLDEEDLRLLSTLNGASSSFPPYSSLHCPSGNNPRQSPSERSSSPTQRRRRNPRGCRGCVTNTHQIYTVKGPSREVLLAFAFLLLMLWVVGKADGVMFQL